MYDIIIKNGTVIDGTGSEMFKADIGIKDDKISKIGELHNEKGEVEIDAEGKYVCPGFVDVNNHSDTYWQIFGNPDLESLIQQGITTIVGGNCGSSLAPLASAKNIETIQKWANLKEININWFSLNEFFSELEKRKISVNFGTLVGHGTIRRGVLGDQMRNPDRKEMEFMKGMLEKAMQEGALGMSVGLVYTHARGATVEELMELARIVQRYDGVYVTHLRNEGENLMEELAEAIKIALETKVRLHISHLKAVGEKNWPLMEQALDLIQEAWDHEVEITFDFYPYTNIGSVLYTLLPSWVAEGGKKMMLRRLADRSTRIRVAEEMKKMDFNFSNVEIGISNLNKTLARKKIADIAAAQNKSVEEAVIDILLASDGRVIISSESLSEENLKKAIQSDLSIVASNGSGYNLAHEETGEVVHPRCFGTFPRALRKYAVDKKIISWEEVIMKMTGLPAGKFNLRYRGELKEKNFADIVVIDPKKIQDFATSENPYRYNQGVEQVIVNGQMALNQGKYQSNKNGEIIRR